MPVRKEDALFLAGDCIGCLTRLALGKVVNVGAGGMPQANITLG